MFLKAYWINGYDIYAGNDLEEAIAAAMCDSGRPRDKVFDEDGGGEVDPATLVLCVDRDPGGPDLTTVGAILAAMSGPGIVCSAEE
jgi:hypothetical protein